MKKRYYLLIASVTFVSIFAVLQTDSKKIENENRSIEAELQQWDPVRGIWLAESLEAMKEKKAIPDRMFPEDLTPHQMISLLPNDLRKRVERSLGNGKLKVIDKNRRVESQRTAVPMQTSNCGTMSARTYGDPHLVTYDGARYSFQTVGEFVLTKSTSGMEIQTRQKPEKENFSLNTAVAMNVGGDRVGLYASDYPDGDNSTPLRVNGKQVSLKSTESYFLPFGGIVRKDLSGRYVIDWATGESATVKFSYSGSMRFLNVSTIVSKCGQYDGLLGNANGIKGDDFGNLNDQEAIRIPEGNDVFTGSSQEVEQSRLAYIANTLGDQYRITPYTSLFDYPEGTSTYTFTDRSFPRVHMTLEEVPEEDLEEARRRCREEAIANNDMNGCIYDQVYLEIEPEPAPEVRNPTEGVILRPIVNPVPNVNSGSGGTVNGNNPTRPSLDPIKDERKPAEDTQTRNPKDEASKDSEYRDQQIQYQRELEAQQQRENRLREEEAEREEREERAREERLERERREYEREQEAEEAAARERDRQERADRERADREREEQEARERQERIDKEEAEQEEREREERLEREQKEKEERLEREKRERERKAEAEAQRKRQEEARRKKEAADKKAREDAARRAKEAAEKKRREETERNNRGGR